MTDYEEPLMVDPVKILIVDDIVENIILIKGLLESPDRELFTAETGVKAIELTLVHDFALVLMDVQMPGMSGFEVAEHLRAEEKTRHTPIVFVTAVVRNQDYVFRGYEAGAIDFMYKPINPVVLRGKVTALTEIYRRQNRLAEREAYYRDLAEFADAVLHNVSNILGSVSLSGSLIDKSLKDSRIIKMEQASKMLEEHRDDPTFFTEHPKGKVLYRYLMDLGHLLEEERRANMDETELLRKHLRLMGDMIQAQQMRNAVAEHVEAVELTAIVRDALDVKSGMIKSKNLRVVNHLEGLLHVRGWRPKLVHMFINLIKNSVEAIAAMPDGGVLTISRQDMENGMVRITLVDTGIGISAEKLSRLFEHGFTTKEWGRGFGLSYCSRTMAEIKGAIHITSPGEGQGAATMLDFVLCDEDGCLGEKKNAS